MRIFILTLVIVFSSVFSHAQNRNSIWCFGDSAGIDFSNIAIPVPIHTSLKTRGSCVSVSDTIGQLLFYAHTRATIAGNTTQVFNKVNDLMQNGSNIVGEGWYLELSIIPDPINNNIYYLFSIGIAGSSQLGLYYSIIDMTLDSGRGAVTIKNVQLQSWPAVDCLTAIKHGNGRDWWLIVRPWDNTNSHYVYLISPSGISQQAVQFVGSVNTTNAGRYNFNTNGSQLCFNNYKGLIELYDFDRCTGLISNPVTFENESPTSPFPQYIDCEFSSNDSLLYVSQHLSATYLLQYNLTSPNPSQTKDTIDSITFPTFTGGFLKLAPDKKIYWSNAWYDGVNYNFPYPDTTFNTYNMNLSVINSPDSLGAACNFQPYSFYLGGNRTYWGLPNNPDYEMKPLYGSACDSLSAGVENLPAPKSGELYVTYISAWEKAFINAQHLRGTTYMLTVTDVMGRIVFKERGKIQPPYFTKDLDCSSFSKGMYIVTLTTNKEQLSLKFIRN